MLFKRKIKNNNKNFCHIINIINDINNNEEIDLIEDSLKRKIIEFKKNKSCLKIISDFDYTLTQKYHSMYGNLYSSYAILNYSTTVSDNLKQTSKELFKKYSPIESDTTLDFNERDKLIKKWFKEDLDLMLKEKITKNDFREMVQQAENKFYFRYGILELFEIVFHNHIPIYIISGGIQEIIEETFRLLLPHYETMKENNMIHIISNSFTYDENGVINGHKEPFVYTFNKGEVSIFKIGIKKYF
jgi:HAD superfamily hydrolase (TIGR01544 family)